jgi:hypothetical protein
MEQKDNVEMLLAAAANSGSFDEYLATVEKLECDKPASAEGNLLPTSNVSENEMGVSSPSSSADDASKPVDPRTVWASKPNYIMDGHKTEHLAHPVPSEVKAIEATTSGEPTPDTPEFQTKLEIKEHPIVGQYLAETQVKTENDKADWWAETFLGGKRRAADMASLETVIDWIHQMDEAIAKIKATQQGARSHIEDALKGMTSKRREEVAKHDRGYRQPKKVDADGQPTKAKVSSKPSSTAGKTKGMKAADALVTGMGYTYEETVEKLKATNLWDEATEKYVNATYKG